MSGAHLPPLERGLALLELAANCPDGMTWKQAHAHLGPVSSATVSRLLKVLVARDFLIQENGRYLSGPALSRLMPRRDLASLLKQAGQEIASELAAAIGESVVVAAFDGEAFRFCGVAILEGSLGYGAQGALIPPTRGHVLNQVRHALLPPSTVESDIRDGSISYGPDGSEPSWPSYAGAIADGLEAGYFYEDGWRRSTMYRLAVPVLAPEGQLVGAVMTGYASRKQYAAAADQAAALIRQRLRRLKGFEAGEKAAGNKRSKRLKLWRQAVCKSISS